MKARKISVSLPSDTVDDLDYIAWNMGISRSAFLSACLASSLPLLREGVNLAGVDAINGANDYEDMVRRYRTSTKAQIDSMFSELTARLGSVEIQRDLFNDK